MHRCITARTRGLQGRIDMPRQQIIANRWLVGFATTAFDSVAEEPVAFPVEPPPVLNSTPRGRGSGTGVPIWPDREKGSRDNKQIV